MRFLSLIAAVAAVRLQSKSRAHNKIDMHEAITIMGGPSAADIIETCDTSGNGELSKDEAHACIDEHVPEEHREQAHQFIDHVWEMVDVSGNGEVSEEELANAMRSAE